MNTKQKEKGGQYCMVGESGFVEYPTQVKIFKLISQKERKQLKK